MDHNTLQPETARPRGPSRMKLSLSTGIETWFDVDDITIRVWASAWTGKEIVRIEDSQGERIVSEKRSFRFTTPHEFSHGGHRYRVEVRVSLGIAAVRLFRDGVEIDSDMHDARGARVDPKTGKVDRRAQVQAFALSLLAGGLAGVAFGYLIGSLFK